VFATTYYIGVIFVIGMKKHGMGVFEYLREKFPKRSDGRLK